MTFKIKHLTCKNFMSVGNATQAIDFDRTDLTLVLGENLEVAMITVLETVQARRPSLTPSATPYSGRR